MKAETLRTVEVREVAAALAQQDVLTLRQHHVNRETCERYLLLSDQQYWQLVGFLGALAIAHSDCNEPETQRPKLQMK